MAVSRVSFEPLPRDSQQQSRITLAQLQNRAGDPTGRQRLAVAQKLCAIANTHQETHPTIAKARYLRALDWLTVMDSGVEGRGEVESLVLKRLAKIYSDPRASNQPRSCQGLGSCRDPAVVVCADGMTCAPQILRSTRSY